MIGHEEFFARYEMELRLAVTPQVVACECRTLLLLEPRKVCGRQVAQREARHVWGGHSVFRRRHAWPGPQVSRASSELIGDHPVTLAGGGFQTLPVDRSSFPVVLDESGLLKDACRIGDGRQRTTASVWARNSCVIEKPSVPTRSSVSGQAGGTSAARPCVGGCQLRPAQPA